MDEMIVEWLRQMYTVIYEIEATNPYKLPDHHNQFGEAWWNDGDVPLESIHCVFSAAEDA